MVPGQCDSNIEKLYELFLPEPLVRKTGYLRSSLSKMSVMPVVEMIRKKDKVQTLWAPQKM